MPRSAPSRTARLLPVAVGLLAAVRGGNAQGPPEFQGMSGGVAVARNALTLADSALSGDAMLRLEVGYRLRVPWFGLRRRLTVTPQVSLAVTDVPGIPIGSRSVAFSHVDLGLQTAYRVWRVRPYATLRWGKRTLERTETGTDPINYSGTGAGFGGGLEIPITATGRGLDLAFSQYSGDFTTRQRVKAESPTSLGYSGWLIALGWSGRFRGTSLLFH